jgi:hypothetical protein
MEMKMKFSNIFVILFCIIALGCSKDDNSNNNNNNNNQNWMITAKISESITLDFQTNNVSFNNWSIPPPYGSNRELTSIMVSGDNTYTLILTIHDYSAPQETTFKFSDHGNLAKFTINNDTNYKYNSNLSGEITFSTLIDNEWVGSFHFNATCIANNKTIKVYNGKINAKK